MQSILLRYCLYGTGSYSEVIFIWDIQRDSRYVAMDLPSPSDGIDIWDIENGTKVTTLVGCKKTRLDCWSPYSHYITMSFHSGTCEIRIWDTRQWRELMAWKGDVPRRPLTCSWRACIAESIPSIFWTFPGGSPVLWIWHSAGNAVKQIPVSQIDDAITDLAATSDGDTLFLASRAGLYRIASLNSRLQHIDGVLGAEIPHVQAVILPRGRIAGLRTGSLRISSDDRFLLVASDQSLATHQQVRCIHVWDVTSGSLIYTIVPKFTLNNEIAQRD
ncbi:hypothetical protein OBBRIDRAFT_45368 [Obba rivulosa]|uniref:Uncharacterized protein n=1 Tax=Obba rivulosa TaxID=1052685 RepID=A0A8E2AQF1_9APHY|nr:hypothetical protein OBBRIDRAFT_45368 [Obba rivulosa]